MNMESSFFVFQKTLIVKNLYKFTGHFCFEKMTTGHFCFDHNNFLSNIFTVFVFTGHFFWPFGHFCKIKMATKTLILCKESLQRRFKNAKKWLFLAVFGVFEGILRGL